MTLSTETCTNCGVQLPGAAKAKTWKTTTAGILAIVAGAATVIECVFAAFIVIPELGWLETISALGESGIVAVGLAIVMISAIVAMVGGVFALKRKVWGLALAGSICAIFSIILIPLLVNVPLGIAAIVLIALGKGEFERGARSRRSCESDLKERQG